MILLKYFEEFIGEGTVNKVRVNKDRAKSLIAESERKRNYLNRMLEKLNIENDNANDYVIYCYDIIMNLVRAKLFLDGYHISGQGAHEAEVSYLRVLRFPEEEVRFLNQMRYFRNGILYYGTSLDKEYAEKVVAFTGEMYKKLIKMR